MRNVQNNYDITPSQNTVLGVFSLVEGETDMEQVDDIFRQMMADLIEIPKNI